MVDFSKMSIEQVEKLFNEGLDVNQKDKWGKTPLKITHGRYHKIYKYLQDNGAKIY